MFTVDLGDKKYRIEKVTAKTLRDIGGAQAVFRRWIENPDVVDMKKDMDTLIGWFCTLCGNQFTMDEVYDNYPADRIITDIGLAIAAVKAQATEALEEFPSGNDKKKQTIRSKNWFATFTGFFAKRAVSRTR